jgi:hypothetical protein
MANINSHIEAEQALKRGEKLRHIYYTEDEYVIFNKEKKQLQTEDGYLVGDFTGEFWSLQKGLPEIWDIV